MIRIVSNSLRPDETAIYDEISELGVDVWKASLDVVGLNSDPKMFSVMLYKRLWSNHRGYTLLLNNKFDLEADIILRAGIEAAICIAANFRLKDEFVTLMRQDAAFTMQGQIKMHREAGGMEMVQLFEAMLRELASKLPDGKRAAKLDWSSLALKGGVQQLYGFHRNLSGVSSHVTGVSVLRGVVGLGEVDPQDELTNLERKRHPMMMAGATLHGSLLHAGMIGDDVLARKALELLGRFNSISMTWQETEA